MTSDQERSIDALSIIGGGFATADPPAWDGVIEVGLPGGRKFLVNDDGRVLDRQTNVISAYCEDHTFQPEIPHRSSVGSGQLN